MVPFKLFSAYRTMWRRESKTHSERESVYDDVQEASENSSEKGGKYHKKDVWYIFGHKISPADKSCDISNMNWLSKAEFYLSAERKTDIYKINKAVWVVRAKWCGKKVGIQSDWHEKKVGVQAESRGKGVGVLRQIIDDHGTSRIPSWWLFYPE